MTIGGIAPSRRDSEHRPARPVAGPQEGGTAAGDLAPRGERRPTRNQIAGLVVEGVLALPRGYRRGLYLDLLA